MLKLILVGDEGRRARRKRQGRTKGLLGTKADAAFGGNRRLQEFPDGVEDDLDLLVVLGVFPFEGIDLVSQILVRRHDLAKLHEGPHDGDIHQDGAVAVQEESMAMPCSVKAYGR